MQSLAVILHHIAEGPINMQLPLMHSADSSSIDVCAILRVYICAAAADLAHRAYVRVYARQFIRSYYLLVSSSHSHPATVTVVRRNHPLRIPQKAILILKSVGKVPNCTKEDFACLSPNQYIASPCATSHCALVQ